MQRCKWSGWSNKNLAKFANTVGRKQFFKSFVGTLRDLATFELTLAFCQNIPIFHVLVFT